MICEQGLSVGDVCRDLKLGETAVPLVAPVAAVAAAPASDPTSGVGRPNALGSMADTLAQLSTRQKSSADASQAGFSGVLVSERGIDALGISRRKRIGYREK